jgi:hypothetical protein
VQLQRSVRRTMVLVFLGAAHAGAQATAAASLGTLLQRAPGAPWQSASALWQSAQIDSRWTQLAGDGLFAGNGRGTMQFESFSVRASFSPAPVGRVRWSTTADLNADRALVGDMRTGRRVESAVSIAAFGGGAWMGGGAEHGRDIDGRGVRPLSLFGFWRPFGRMSFSVSSSSRRVRLANSTRRQVVLALRDSIYNDTTGHWDFYTRPKSNGDSAETSSRDVQWTEIEARLAWASSRVALDARVGLRPHLAGMPASSWARATTTIALAPRLALVAAAGNSIALSSTLAARTPFVSLGLRVAPSALARPSAPAHVRPVASAFRVVPTDSARYRVIVHAASARTLELSGDFDGWQPVSLAQTAPDQWETTLALAPGTYRVNLRVNGDRWTAPPGLPTADDDFNGTVGLLVIR